MNSGTPCRSPAARQPSNRLDSSLQHVAIRHRAASPVTTAIPLGGALRSVAVAAIALGAACSGNRPYCIAIVLDSAGIEGARLAATRINANGGINGHPLELRVVTGAEKSARMALASAEQLASDESVLAVVGHTNSASSLSASQVYNARGVVQISPTTTSPLYSQAGPYSFRLVPSDIHQGAYLADEALRLVSRGRVAVVFVNSDYGRPLHGVVLDRLQRAGVAPVSDTPFGAIDAAAGSALVASLARADPQVVIWIGRSADLMPVVARLRAALPHMAIIASDAFSRRLPVDSTRHRFDGVRYVRFVDLERPDTVLQNLRIAYRRTHSTEVSDQTLLAYDAVMLLDEALRAAGPRREAIRTWLAAVGEAGHKFTGVTGPVDFVKGRERAPAYVMVQAGT
jgi:branched-chain amino acid transport system substrate-binding protein